MRRAGAHRGLDLDHGGGAHRLPERGRQEDLADRVALGLQEQGPRWVGGEECRGEAALEALLRGLRPQAAEVRAAVVGEALQVDHLGAFLGHELQEPRLRRPGAAVDQDDPVVERALVEHLRDQGAIRPVAAGDGVHAPADLREDRREGAGALPPAPAIDQRSPPAGPVRERALEVRGGVARNEGGADLAGEEAVLPDVDRAHLCPLCVVEDGQRDRAGDVVLRVFGGGADVDDLVEGQGGQVAQRGQLHRHQFDALYQSRSTARSASVMVSITAGGIAWLTPAWR